MDEHALIKKRVIKNNQVPFMNGGLRRAINVKLFTGELFYKFRTSANWELYRKHRNHVVQLRKTCAKDYLRQHTVKSNGGKDFWKLIKPLISNKSGNKSNNVILREGYSIINKWQKLLQLFQSVLMHLVDKCKLDLSVMLTWFEQNCIYLNLVKFQFNLFHNAVLSSDTSMKVGYTILESSVSVKLLGVFVDRRLNFNVHISKTC